MVKKDKGGRPPSPEVAGRRAQVFALLTEGYSKSEIAAKQGRKHYQVEKDITRAVQARLRGTGAIDQYLAVHQARLGELWRAVRDTATTPGKKGQYIAHERAMAVLEREARMMGVDAETRDKLKASALNAGSEVDSYLGGVDSPLPEDDAAADESADWDDDPDDDDEDDSDDLSGSE